MTFDFGLLLVLTRVRSFLALEPPKFAPKNAQSHRIFWVRNRRAVPIVDLDGLRGKVRGSF